MFDSLFRNARPSLASFRRFVQVAEEGSTSAASRIHEVHVSTYNRAIREVEKVVGEDLVDHDAAAGGTVKLTAAGVRLHALAKAFLRNLEEFSAQPDVITIGAGPWMMDHLVIPTLSDIREAFPGMKLDLIRMRDRDEIIQSLNDGGKLDIGVFTESEAGSGEVQHPHQVSTVEYVAVVQESEECSDRETYEWLKNRPIVTLHKGLADNFTRRICSKYEAHLEIQPEIKVFCDSFVEMMCVIKYCGIANAVGFVPDLRTESEKKLFQHLGLKAVAIPALFHKRDIIASWNPVKINQLGFSENMDRVLAAIEKYVSSS